jgi:GT2 family glycosyltransferase
MRPPEVAVVILNYNGKHFLEKFLPSVLAFSGQSTIYVADSASTDGSIAWLKAYYPKVVTIELAANYGYAGGYNRALSQIKADYYLLLNSDVEVTPNWLPPLVEMLQNNAQIAACQPKIRAYHQPESFEYAGAAGGYLDWLGYPFCRGRLFFDAETDTGQYNNASPIFWASGACFLIRAELFHKMNGFDDDFFAHMEEIDLCWRLQLAGHQVFYCPDSVVYHVGGGTLPATNPFKTFLNYRNSLAMLYKNLPSGSKWSVIFLRLILDGISAARFLPTREWANIWAIIRAHFAFYGMLGQLRIKRQKIWTASSQKPSDVALYSKSIIWQYFVKKRKSFSTLDT